MNKFKKFLKAGIFPVLTICDSRAFLCLEINNNIKKIAIPTKLTNLDNF